jgi:alpha-galactosidase/6-phospho-beta-glucosidase family protein
MSPIRNTKPVGKPKVVIIGAGSLFFGRQILWQMAQSKVLRHGTLAYVDTNQANLDRMMNLGKMVIAAAKSPLSLVGSTDRRELLPGADFVVLSFSRRNAYYRGVDTRIAAKHGVLMCSSDTIGPGGIFRALREIPIALDIAADVKKLCPKAWLINYVNPTAVLGIALMRHATGLKNFALCDGNHEPHNTKNYLVNVGIAQKAADVTPAMIRATDLRIAGVNHCTWVLRFEYKGKDMMPRLHELVARRAAEELQKPPDQYSKQRLNSNYALKLYDLYGIFPTAVSHTKEYVPFFQGYGVSKAGLPPITQFDADVREKRHADMWKEVEDYIAGRKPMSEFLSGMRADHAGDIIEGMWGDLGKPFYINGPNQGAVTNLPKDAFLELKRDVTMKGFKARPVGDLPRGVLSLTQQVLDTHELTVEAAVKCDRALLRRAMMTDPIVNNIEDGDAIIADLLAEEKDMLPDCWYR